jgi:hypothetical protein
MRLRTFVVAAALALGMGAASVGANVLANRRTVLTFNRAVALPGTELPAGSYTFQLADPTASNDVVEVLNRDRTRVLFLGLTRPVTRPGNLPADRNVVFGEARRGEPVPITAWYPQDESRGYQFLYGR